MESKEFLRRDILVLIVTVVYYAITQASIDEKYSNGHSGIFVFFTLQTSLQVVFTLLLIASDIYHKKTLNLSLRSGAFFLVLGMTTIVAFLGLFSIWMIIYFAFVEYQHALLFAEGLKMDDDDHYQVMR